MTSQLVLASPDPQVWRLLGFEDDAEGGSGGLPHAAVPASPAGAPVELDVGLL